MRIVHLGFDPDFVDYEWAWERQRELHAKVVSGQEPDTVLLLEHQPVYTAGKRTEAHERPNDGTPVVDVRRYLDSKHEFWPLVRTATGRRSTSSPMCERLRR